jgi:hypothetical protein
MCITDVRNYGTGLLKFLVLVYFIEFWLLRSLKCDVRNLKTQAAYASFARLTSLIVF